MTAITLGCPKCGQAHNVNIDQPQFAHLAGVSMLLLEHQGVVTCHCGIQLLPVIIRAHQLQMGLKPCETHASKNRLT